MENSHIQWTDHTQNFWIGCTKVSPGCAHCYAEARDKRFAEGIHWGKGSPRQRTGPSNWRAPLKWNRDALTMACGDCDPCLAGHAEACALGIKHPKVFCSSLSDIFDSEIPIDWFAEAMGVVKQCTALTWLLLTKRPELFRDRIGGALNYLSTKPATNELFSLVQWLQGWQSGNEIPSNIWMGTSVENQEYADRRVPALLAIPAKIRFLSCEPLLGPVDLNEVPLEDRCYGPWEGPKDNPVAGIHWVIIGGESGTNARPFGVDWARSLVEQCKAAGVAPFVKQLGRAPFEHCPKADIGGVSVVEACDFLLLLNDKKGGDMSEWAPDLRVREFPK